MLIKILGPQQHCINGFEVSPDQKVASLRRELAARLNIENDVGIRLMFCGRILQNERSLSEYNISENSTIHLVIRAVEATNGKAEQTTVQSINVSSTQGVTIHTNTGVSPPSYGTTPFHATTSHDEPSISDETHITVSSRHSSDDSTNSSNSKAQKEAATPAQPQGPVVGVYLHIHCNLAELDLLPERLSKTIQQINQSHGSCTLSVPKVEIHCPNVSHPQQRSEEVQSPTPVQVLSFFEAELYRLMGELSLMDIMSMTAGNMSFFINKRKDLRKKLDEHLVQHLSIPNNSESSRGDNETRLQAMADLEGDFLISHLMMSKHVLEMLKELAPCEAERECIISELRNVFKYIIYKLQKIIQDVEPTDDAQWLGELSNLILDAGGVIMKRAQDKWFQGRAEPSVVVQKLHAAVTEEIVELIKNKKEYAPFVNLIPPAIGPVFQRLEVSYETYRNNHPDDQNEIFTQWRDAIAKKETAQDDVLLEALDELEEQAPSSLVDTENALAEWEKLGKSQAEAAKCVRQLLECVDERPV